MQRFTTSGDLPNRTMTNSTQTAPQALPQGRFLYQAGDEPTYGLFGRHDVIGLWISARHLIRPNRSAGPFETGTALRALRLANVSIPDGCALGPWQDGLALFAVTSLPEPFYNFRPVEPRTLEPSMTSYGSEDLAGEVANVRCAPPTAPPKATWASETDAVVRRCLEQVLARAPDNGRERDGDREQGREGRRLAAHEERGSRRRPALGSLPLGHAGSSIIVHPSQ